MPCKDVLRAVDWAATPLGAYEQWPTALKSYVSMVLEMPTPAIIFWGTDQLQLYNDGYAVIMGPRHPRYFGSPYRECWPDTHPVIHPWMQRVLAGEVVTVDKTLFKLTRHGFLEEAYFTFTFSPLRDDDGVIRGILQPVVEVTSEVLRMRRDQTLRELERIEESDDVLEHALAVAARNVHDIAFLRWFSPAEAAEHGPRPVAEVLSSRMAVVESVGMVLGSPHVGVWETATRDAYVIPLLRSGGPTQHGVIAFGISPHLEFDDRYRSFFASFAREVAAQMDTRATKRAEQELFARIEAARTEAEIQRGRLQSVFMQAPLAIGILLGPDYEIALANPSICQIWGRPIDAVLGRRLFDAIPELSGQGIRELLDGVRASGQPFMGMEVPMKFRRDAHDTLEEQFFFNFLYHPLVEPNGDVAGVIGVGVDVSMQVRARQAVERLATDLDVARRDAEVALDAAQRANLAKDEFLAMLGHELRNPLAPIFTALDLMRMKEVSANRELEVVERQARHLAALVDDLLDVSRIRMGKVDLDRQRVRLGDVIAKAAETASPLLEKRRHQLALDIDADIEINGDGGRLTQVFANLLTNAAKYTDDGGRIAVQARATSDGHAVVDVSDNGRGISEQMLPRVFDLFAQERQNIDRAQGGLGLGLAIVRSIVGMHGGTVEARSEGPGRGSTFSVRLPLDSRADSTGDHARDVVSLPVSPASSSGQRLLVVDDNEDAASLLADALSLRGHACTVAHDGLEALALARASRYDAVLLDIGLPGIDGYEVARQLRTLPRWADVPLVAITGYGQYSDQQRAREAGFNHHFVKPVDLATLMQFLDEVSC